MMANTLITRLTSWLTVAALELLSLAQPHFLKPTERHKQQGHTPGVPLVTWGLTDSTALGKSPEAME